MIESQSRVNPNQLQFTPSEEPSTLQWTAFYVLQLADIYTTYHGLKYDCIKELNPIVGESPSVGEMVALKTAILLPAIEIDRKNDRLTSQAFSEMNFLMTIVLANNFEQISNAKKYCKKR